MPEQHAGQPDGTCSCSAPGWLARLSCGCLSWSHGQPRIGGYIMCGTSLAHQASYKILETREGRPGAEAS
jgi:hypothetical protein